MPDRVISVPQATQIATKIKNKFDNVNGRLDELGGGTAEDTSYDNTDSGLTATNVQAAIDELAVLVGEADTLLGTGVV